MGIVITFIVFFTVYISFTNNYAKTFKTKDDILLAIERYKGLNNDSISAIKDLLRRSNYSSTGSCIDNSNEIYSKGNGYNNSDNKSYTKWRGLKLSRSANTLVNNTSNEDINVCFRRYKITEKGYGSIGHPTSTYYQVLVFFNVDWPVFDTIFNLRVYGESAIIYQYDDSVNWEG